MLTTAEECCIDAICATVPTTIAVDEAIVHSDKSMKDPRFLVYAMLRDVVKNHGADEKSLWEMHTAHQLDAFLDAVYRENSSGYYRQFRALGTRISVEPPLLCSNSLLCNVLTGGCPNCGSGPFVRPYRAPPDCYECLKPVCTRCSVQHGEGGTMCTACYNTCREGRKGPSEKEEKEAPSSFDSSPSRGWELRAWVCANGLCNQTELNGQCGRVVALPRPTDGHMRYGVEFENGRHCRVRAQHLLSPQMVRCLEILDATKWQDAELVLLPLSSRKLVNAVPSKVGQRVGLPLMISMRHNGGTGHGCRLATILLIDPTDCIADPEYQCVTPPVYIYSAADQEQETTASVWNGASLRAMILYLYSFIHSTPPFGCGVEHEGQTFQDCFTPEKFRRFVEEDTQDREGCPAVPPVSSPYSRVCDP